MNLKKLAAPLVVFFALAICVTLSPTMLRAFLPEQPIGTWVSGPTMSQVREAATSTVMYDGRVLVTGGKNQTGEPLASAEVVGLSGTINPVASMNIPRAGHAAVWLYDGYVLVSGGITSGGGVTNTAELYDPLSDTWTLLQGVMIDPRTGHTATNLLDGRILIAGGSNGSSPLTSAETFSIVNERFEFAGTMDVARQHHAAAALADGKVLLVGGSTTDGTTLSTTQIFDPETNTLEAGPALNEARQAATATTLIDGTVLVAGGRDPELAKNGVSELATVELIDLTTRTAHTLPATMSMPHADHTAILLADNNQVLLLGGITAGVPNSSADLYTPWTGQLNVTASMNSARQFPVATNLAISGRALVAGGKGLSTSEVYSFATVKTDRTDYLPGMTVNVSGTGWVPGETVHISVTSGGVTRMSVDTKANAWGNISDSTFAPTTNDLNAVFYLTATGSQSQAQTTFTDGTLTVRVTGPGSVTGSRALSPATCTSAQTAGCTVSLPSNNNITLTASGATVQSWTATGIPVVSGCTAGATTCTVGPLNGNNNSGTVTVAFNKLTPTITTLPSASPITFGQSLASSTLSGGVASVPGTFAFTTPSTVPGSSGSQSVTFTPSDTTNYNTATGSTIVTVNPAPVVVSLSNLVQTYDGTPKPVTVTTNPTGIATSVTYNGSATTPILAGSYTVVATVTAPNYTGSASGTLTIGQANQTISFGALPNKTFGDAPIALNATASSGLPVSYSVGATDNCGVAGTTLTITGAGSCTVTASQGGNSNYNAALPIAQSFTISKGLATISLNNLSQTFDGTPKPVSVITVPSDVATTVTYNGSLTPPTNAGSYGISVTVNDANYAGSTAGVLTINKAPATISISNLSQTYDGSPKAVTVTTSPTGVSFSVTYDGDHVAPTNAASYAVSATVTDANYTATPANATLVIAKAAASITLAGLTQNYDGTPKAVTATTVPGGLPTLITYAGNSTAPSNAGSYAIEAIITNPNYIGTSIGTLTINPAVANVVLGGLSATYDGSAKSATVTTMPAGLNTTITYDGSPSAPTNAGSYSVAATINAPNYTGTASGTLTIAKASQSITFAALANKDAADVPFAIAATASSGLPVNFSASGSCTVVGSTVTLTGLGSCTITASQAGNGNYNSATPVPQSFSIGGGVPVISWIAPQPITYGTPISAAQLNASATYSGSGVTGTYDYSPAIGTVLSVGSHTLSVTFHPADSAYNTASATVPISVAPANVTVTAPSLSRVYGDPNPTFTPQYNGFVNGESNAVIATSAVCSSTASVTSAVGSYPVTCSGASAANYQFVYSPGVLTVSPATLTVTPANNTRPQGQANPTFTGTVTGIRNSDPLVITYTTTATTASPAGTYPITATVDSGISVAAANYNLVLNTGTLTVTNSKPDLVETISVSTQAAISGGLLTVTDTTSNIGGTNAPASSTRFYLMSGSTRVAVLGTRLIGVLVPGSRSGPATTTLSLPTNIGGTFSVQACADDSLAVTESDENNNCNSSSTFSVTGADLVVSSITVPSSGVSGASFTVSDTTANQGVSDARTSSTRFYLVSGSTRVAVLGTRLIGVLAPGASSGPVGTALTLPANIAGTFSVVACADDSLAVTESDENNNCTSSGTFSVNGADLVVSTITVPSSGVSGGNISISDTTTNNGVSDARASSTRFYLVSGTTRVAVLGTRLVGVLAAGASSGPAATTATLPKMTGVYTVQACADETLAVNEINENNNCLSSSIITITK